MHQSAVIGPSAIGSKKKINDDVTRAIGIALHPIRNAKSFPSLDRARCPTHHLDNNSNNNSNNNNNNNNNNSNSNNNKTMKTLLFLALLAAVARRGRPSLIRTRNEDCNGVAAVDKECYVSDGDASRCYCLLYRNATLEQARRMCRDEGGMRLAALETRQELAELLEFLHFDRRLFAGSLHDLALLYTDGEFRNTTTTTTSDGGDGNSTVAGWYWASTGQPFQYGDWGPSFDATFAWQKYMALTFSCEYCGWAPRTPFVYNGWAKFRWPSTDGVADPSAEPFFTALDKYALCEKTLSSRSALGHTLAGRAATAWHFFLVVGLAAGATVAAAALWLGLVYCRRGADADADADADAAAATATPQVVVDRADDVVVVVLKTPVETAF